MDAAVAGALAWLFIIALAVSVLAAARWIGGRLSPLVVGVLIRLGWVE